MATNKSVTGSYCLSKKVTRITSHHLYYSIMLKMSASVRRRPRSWHDRLIPN